ncbi:hypothetical protein KF707_04395 [Candidatus Obscuribacterales bacterium]|jgi:hypothetical protein|nr:hypothetical protein [Candidatus Obscuribacterales bacterium]MBX3135449.1 hypothetical protein [Candidatus Obscuribacterales bacterium]MBX3151581.1 hypothetical protein [Candidatus Obscuribacterales bacterium]
MGELEKTATEKPHVKHDWTFFFFIAITSLLIAAAIAWVSVKSGMVSAENDIDTTVVNSPVR